MVKIVGKADLSIPVTLIEWAPRNWSNRMAWGPEATDGFYMTKGGEVYRLCGHVVIYVTEQAYLQ